MISVEDVDLERNKPARAYFNVRNSHQRTK